MCAAFIKLSKLSFSLSDFISDFSAVTSEGLLPLTCRNVPLRAGIALLPPGVQTVSTHKIFPANPTSRSSIGLSCALPPRCLIGWLRTDCSKRQKHRIA